MSWFLLLIILPYLFLLSRIISGLMKLRPFQPDNNPSIFVSVIVACRNEAQNLPLLLSDFLTQSYDQDLFELLVIDDNSTDSTFRIASDFIGIKNLKVLRNNGNGKKKAIKTGVEVSAGSIVISTDADCRRGNDWLKVIASFYSRFTPEMIICPVTLEQGTSFLARFQELEFLSLQGITAGSAMINRSTMCNGANLAFTRDVFMRHSAALHYDIQSGDDIFLLHSIKKEMGSGIRWLESDKAIVTAASMTTLKSYLKQRKRWISKSRYYNDSFTSSLGIVTFVTIFVQQFLLAWGLVNHEILIVFSVFTILKSIPDFIILSNVCRRYGRMNLLKWFLPSIIVYPFYVTGVMIYPGVRKAETF